MLDLSLLNDGEVACHPFIVGELACGNLKNRTTDAFASGSSADGHCGGT